VEDPYNYRDGEQLRTIPKYMINAAGDEFFVPDNSQFYFGDLKGEKYIRYEPNAKHNLAGTDVRENMTAFYQSVLEGSKRPRFTWKKLADGALRVEAKDEPAEVRLWQASNPSARDFRLDVIGKAYQSTMLKPASKGVYEGRVAKPATGYTAFFVELTYPRGTDKPPFKFTTEVSVVPDVLPYKWQAAFEKYPKKN
jgi:PhoPQ-activated pathogenicity-related protein